MTTTHDTPRKIALYLWEKELGKPYVWGGDDAIAGFDCSGVMIEHLKSVGRLPRKGDWNAQGLYNLFSNHTVYDPQPGCLLFWNRGSKIGHVEVVWKRLTMGASTVLLTIGASGGGSRTITEQDAIDQNAYIKVRPATGWDFAVDPFKGRALR